MNALVTRPPAEEDEWCRSLMPVARLFAARHGVGERDDLAQEAITVLLGAIRDGRVSDRGQAGRFLFATCKSLALSRHRTDQRRGALLEREAPALAAVEPPQLLDRRRLWLCLNQLAARSREVVLRSYVDDETAPEIARSAGLSEANVRVIRHRAMVALHQCITKDAR
jgi:RNA polymerase sigma-70 factor, ECF subfamily